MSVESEGPPAPPVLDRKISTFSETDSGVEVDNEAEEAVDTSLEKRVIKPDLDIISKLCNFDEEEEQDMTESENDSSDDESSSCEQSSRLRLTLLELRHILSALVKQHTEEELEPSAAGHVLVGKSCSVCRQNIFSMLVYTGARCQICSFTVCIHCSLQVELLSPDTVYDLPVSVLSPAVALAGERIQSNKFSSLTVSSLATNMWGRVTRSSNHVICSTCSYVINQAL